MSSEAISSLSGYGLPSVHTCRTTPLPGTMLSIFPVTVKGGLLSRTNMVWPVNWSLLDAMMKYGGR